MSVSAEPTPSPGGRFNPVSAAATTARLRPGAILRGLSRVWRTAALYGKDHPVIERLLGDLLHTIEALLADRPSLTIFIHEETFFVDNTMLLEESVHLSPLLVELKKRGVLAVTVWQGLDVREVRVMISMLSTPADEVRQSGGASEWLTKQGVRHVVVGGIKQAQILREADVRVDPRDAYRAGVRVMEDLYGQATGESGLDLTKASLVVESLLGTLIEHKTGLMGAAIIKNFDEDTCQHSVNVCILSLFMASRLRLDRSSTAILGLASLLHDIGKVRVPIEILTKPGRLSPTEWPIMQRHTLYGAQILSTLSSSHARLAMVVAFEHHANFDLSGYPQITTKRRPHLLARIVQVVDSFDAATSSRRTYRKPMIPAQAVQMIRGGAGTNYDPDLAGAFVREFGMYPVGTVVALDGGATGIVCRPGSRHPNRPTVRIIDPQASTPVVLDELDLETQRDRSVTQILDAAELGIDVTDYVAPAR